GLPRPGGGISFSYPVLDASGGVAAVAFLSIGREKLAASLVETPIRPDAVIGLFDATGTVLARVPDRAGAPGGGPGTDRFGAIRAGDVAVVESDELDGTPRLVGVAPLAAPLDLHVAVGVPMANLFAAADNQFRWKMALFGAVFALAAVAALAWGEIGL